MNKDTSSLQPIIYFDNDLLSHVTGLFKELNEHAYDLDEILRSILDFFQDDDVTSSDMGYNVFISSKYGEVAMGGVKAPGSPNTEEQVSKFEEGLLYLFTILKHTLAGYYYSDMLIGKKQKPEPFKHVYFQISDNLGLTVFVSTPT